jgi:hypothetical protein
MCRLVAVGAALLVSFSARGACPGDRACGSNPGAASSFTETDVRQWLAVWRQREGLQDWVINLQFVHWNFRKDADADIQWWGMPGTANIRFVEPGDWGVYGLSPAAARSWAQKAVVHELMHLIVGRLYFGNAAWVNGDAARDGRMEAIVENLAAMLLYRRAPGGMPVAEYVRQQVDSGPWRPASDVRRAVMVQVVRAMNRTNEDDVLLLANR